MIPVDRYESEQVEADHGEDREREESRLRVLSLYRGFVIVDRKISLRVRDVEGLHSAVSVGDLEPDHLQRETGIPGDPERLDDIVRVQSDPGVYVLVADGVVVPVYPPLRRLIPEEPDLSHQISRGPA